MRSQSDDAEIDLVATIAGVVARACDPYTAVASVSFL